MVGRAGDSHFGLQRSIQKLGSLFWSQDVKLALFRPPSFLCRFPSWLRVCLGSYPANLPSPGIFLKGRRPAFWAGAAPTLRRQKNNYCIKRSGEFFPRVLIAGGQARSGTAPPPPTSWRQGLQGLRDEMIRLSVPERAIRTLAGRGQWSWSPSPLPSPSFWGCGGSCPPEHKQTHE